MKEPVQNFVMRTSKQEDRIKPCETSANKPPTSKASSAVRSTKQSQLIAMVEAIKENATEEFTTNQNTPSKDQHQTAIQSTPI
jgi:hypothetical protein